MPTRLASALPLAALVLGAACAPVETAPADTAGAAPAAPAAPAAHALLDAAPPPDSAIPDGPWGESVRRGRAIFVRTTDSLPAYAPGSIQCASCHLDAGRQAGAASLVGVMARYPKYMDRTGAVVGIVDRVNYCFTRSMAGTRLPDGSREMTDLVAYMAFLSQGVPHGARVAGEGMPTLPPLTGDTARGAELYAATCVACHGADGAGLPPATPALWGPRSYSIGASMAREERAASFIKHFMPLGQGGTLTDQQAYDLAAYVNAQPRPDSPAKERDWPRGGAPADVPYATAGHAPHRPPARLLPRANPEGAIVGAPASVRGAGER